MGIYYYVKRLKKNNKKKYSKTFHKLENRRKRLITEKQDLQIHKANFFNGNTKQ